LDNEESPASLKDFSPYSSSIAKKAQKHSAPPTPICADADAAMPEVRELLEVFRKGDIDFFAGGHLFKFAPALGEWLAGVALGGDVPTFFAPEMTA